MQKTVLRAWKLSESDPEASEVFSSYHSVIANLLWDRGVRTKDEAQKFFEPNYERDLHDPFLFRGMRAAVERIYLAFENGEHITIHGDYDADGVTGSAVLVSTLRDLSKALSIINSPPLMGGEKGEGGHPLPNPPPSRGRENIDPQIDFYVPHREREGYGLHEATVDLLAERGTNLIITVDCGIANVAAIAKATEHGIDTIVVDHHEFPDELPDAILIHPRLPGESYPFPSLAAVGVAWKVACALYTEARARGLAVSPHAEKWLLDLVAIATVTDIMPLTGENRALEYFGLKVLRKTKRPGFQKLFEVAGIKPEKIDTFAVGFQIGPRLNAAGRMEHADAAFQLLVAETAEEAEIFALKLQEQNSARQVVSNHMFEEARLQVIEQQSAKLLWAYDENWSPGLVGLVAGKLAQEFAKPVLVMGSIGNRVIGSGRSVAGFHITEALREVGECLEKFGGHPQACGFTLMTDRREEFINLITNFALVKLNEVVLEPSMTIDAELELNDLTDEFAEMLGKFAPYGEANPLPRFVTRDLTITQSDLVGETGRHLRLRLTSTNGKAQKFIAFGFGVEQARLAPGTKIDVVYEVGVNEWNGSREVQCKLVDFHIV